MPATSAVQQRITTSSGSFRHMPCPREGRAAAQILGTARPHPILRRALLAGEVGLALLDVGAEPFLRVVALEQLLLQLALDRERLLERDLGAALHRALDAPDRLRRLVRRAELLGVLLDLLEELGVARGLPDLVHDPELRALLEVEGLAGDHQLDRGAL